MLALREVLSCEEQLCVSVREPSWADNEGETEIVYKKLIGCTVWKLWVTFVISTCGFLLSHAVRGNLSDFWSLDWDLVV